MKCKDTHIALNYYCGLNTGLPFETIVATDRQLRTICAYPVCDYAVRLGLLRACYDGVGANIDGDGLPAIIIIILVRSFQFSHLHSF